jgi:hypothetical protein
VAKKFLLSFSNSDFFLQKKKICDELFFLYLIVCIWGKFCKKIFVAKIIKFKHNPKKNDLGLDAIMNVCFPI